MTVVNLVNYNRTQALGLPVFSLQINNWGNRGTGADVTSLSYGGDPDQTIGSVLQAVIGADSTADRAVVQFTPLFNFVSLLPLPETYNPVFMQRISVPRPSAQLSGSLVLRCDSVNFYHDGYFRDGDPVIKPFGGTEPRFESPIIGVDFFLKAPGLIPSQRNPMFRRFQEDATTHVGGGEQLIAIYPVFGRKSFTSHFRATGDIAGTVRVGAISYSLQGLVPSLVCSETTLGTASINGTTMAQATIAQSLNAQYLALYYTAGAGNGGFVQGHMLADDAGTCCGTFKTDAVI